MVGVRTKKRTKMPLNGGMMWGKTILTPPPPSSSPASSLLSSPKGPITTRKHSSLLYLTVKPDYLVIRAPCGPHSPVSFFATHPKRMEGAACTKALCTHVSHFRGVKHILDTL